MFLFGLASEATLGELWTYLALLPIFVIQLVWPTIFGWRVLFAGWFMFFFLFDVFGGAPPGVFPIFWGLGLLVPLYVFRPRIDGLLQQG